MKILYLYAEVMGYTMATIEVLANAGAEVHVVQWDDRKLTPYRPPALANVTLYQRSQMNTPALQELARTLSPDITVVSGWLDRGYLAVARKLRAAGRPVVVGFDDQWHGTVRQRLGSVLGATNYLGRYFSHAWVSGVYQYEYAARLGFAKQRILYDLYSADIDRFHASYRNSLAHKERQYPHRFLFVGRFEPVKGIDTLMRAWKLLGPKRRDWQLQLVGHGSLRATLPNEDGLIVTDFMQPDELMREVEGAGCFVLASREEPWGVVVHELAAAGLPLVLSNVVGAAPTFLISGANGFVFNANNPCSLAETMRRIVETPDADLLAMSATSHRLSHRITPQTSAANLLAAAGAG